MTAVAVGARVQTRRGLGTVLAATAYQVQVQPDSGDDPYWTLHRDVQPAPIEDEEREPTVAELVDAAQQLLELARVKLQRSTPEQAVAPPHTGARDVSS